MVQRWRSLPVVGDLMKDPPVDWSVVDGLVDDNLIIVNIESNLHH